ncbi:Poly(A)+ RNA export [Paramyrothecium foliicola]|nr:Poly(A)+ RNA export [Paramyrothecium foliicola]
MSTLFGAANSTTPILGDLKNDVALSDPPSDSISDLAFSPAPNGPDFLAVSSWDNKVRIYEINQSGQSQGRHAYEHSQPVLNCDWSRDGTKLASAGADKNVKVCDIGSQQDMVVGTHDQPVRCVRFFENNGTPMLISGSWDKTIKYWDLRLQTPAATIQYRYINVINLKDPTKFYKTLQSPLKWQTRVVSCFADSMGFAIGSIEGRCAFQYVEEKDSRCHRDPPLNNVTNVYAVNDISFHPVHGTFSTAGSDGTFHFWDKDAKHRLKGYPNVGGSITATIFNKNSTIFAYAVSYDWSKGYQFNTQQYPTKVMLHPINGDECSDDESEAWDKTTEQVSKSDDLPRQLGLSVARAVGWPSAADSMVD